MIVLALDAGNSHTGFAVLCENYNPIKFGKANNFEVLKMVSELNYDVLVCEMVASYGMPVGATVFETCCWIGRFEQAAFARGIRTDRIFRKEEKLNLCGSMQAKDGNIRRALIDRFAKTESGKGTKADPDFFYGFSADAWTAYAVGVTYIDKLLQDIKYERMIADALEMENRHDK